jgi:hypothetical protein
VHLKLFLAFCVGALAGGVAVSRIVVPMFKLHVKEELTRSTVYEEPARQLDELYAAYLESDRAGAEEKMKQSVSILERTQFPNPSGRAHGLWLTYARLHVLAAIPKHSTLADEYLLKARYWYLKDLEIDLQDSEKAMKMVSAFDSARCVEVVKSFDQRNTDGKGARYLRESGD